MTGLWLRMDPNTLVRALETPQDCDEVMKAAALRKRLLTGQPALDLAAAEASPANPYGSAKHGAFGAPSAAAVAEGVEPLSGTAQEALDAYYAPGHLPQHTHGEPGCTFPGCTEHVAAVAR